jgi:hypothetical protein
MKISWQYLAGLFEGDGSCGCYPIKFQAKPHHKPGIYWRLTFSLHNSDKTLLDRVADWIDFGCLCEHKLHKTHYGRKRMYMYMTHSRQALTILTKIRPFVVGNYKRNQLERAINKYGTAKKGVV